jgi:flagellar motor protein MotB
MRRVAVMHLANLTREPGAGEKVRRVVIAELLATDRFEVVEPGAVDKAAQDLGLVFNEPLTARQAYLLGQKLDVQGIFVGSVNEYGTTKAGGTQEAPEVSLSLLLMDPATGQLLWSADEARGGLTFWVRHFGAEPARVSEQARSTVRAALATLFAGPTRKPFDVDEAKVREQRTKMAVLEAQESRNKRVQAMAEMLSGGLHEQVAQKVLEVRREEPGLKLVAAMDVFFNYGQVVLSDEGKTVLAKVASVLRERGSSARLSLAVYPEKGEIAEEVQTRYSTLWELAAARAGAILAALEKEGLNPANMAASYHGATPPGGEEMSERVEMAIAVGQPSGETEEPSGAK